MSVIRDLDEPGWRPIDVVALALVLVFVLGGLYLEALSPPDTGVSAPRAAAGRR